MTVRLLPLGARGDISLGRHLRRYGALPELGVELVGEVERSGLTGRGGAGFPTAVKLAAVARKRAPVVVANGAEGEPVSAKDAVLMTLNPHLVLDGIVAALATIGGSEAFVAVAARAVSARAALERALGERLADALRIRIVSVPDRFVAGEESALVSFLSGGEAKPTFKPPRPTDRGMLVQNVETLANLALIGRFGADWFRTAPTVLGTVSGAVRRPGVVEVELDVPLSTLVDRCGGLAAPARAVLVGGYFGTWIGADALALPFSEKSFPLGARAVAVLPHGVCGVAETARIVRYLAAESAGQCGPCVFGLPALAEALDSPERVAALRAQIARRGACALPDGALQLVDSAVRVFADEIDLHLRGRCSATKVAA